MRLFYSGNSRQYSAEFTLTRPDVMLSYEYLKDHAPSGTLPERGTTDGKRFELILYYSGTSWGHNPERVIPRGV